MLNEESDSVAAKLLHDAGQNFSLEQRILNEAFDIYKKGLSKKQLKLAIKDNSEFTLNQLIAGALLVALRENLQPMTLDELSSYFRIRKSDLAISYRLFCIALKIKMQSTFQLGQLLYVLRKIEDKHVLSDEIYTASEELLKKVSNPRIENNDWKAIIAAIIFIEINKLKEHVSLEEISEASGVSKEVILRKAKELFSIN